MKRTLVVITIAFFIMNVANCKKTILNGEVKEVNELHQIEESSSYFYDCNKNVYCVFNSFNSSGTFIPVSMQANTLFVTDNDSPELNIGNCFFSPQVTILDIDQNHEDLFSLGAAMFSNYFQIAIKLDDVSVGDFRVLGNSYAVSKKHAYFEYKVIADADPVTFTILNGSLARDNKSVFYENIKLDYLDPTALQLLNEGYVKDNKYVYYRNMLIDGADGLSFKVLSYNYQIDKNRVYYFGNPMNIDKETFELIPNERNVLSPMFVRDKNHVFFQGDILEGADPKTFSMVGSYGKDKNYVYSSYDRIEGADAKSFRKADSKTEVILDGYDAYDCNYKYTKFGKERKLLTKKEKKELFSK